jgi:hypothetical protein
MALLRLNGVAHGYGLVGFSVGKSGYCCERSPGDKFTDEDNAPTPTLWSLPTDVEAQIHFVEVPVKWDRHPQHPRLEKAEADDADEVAAIPRVQLGTGWEAAP